MIELTVLCTHASDGWLGGKVLGKAIDTQLSRVPQLHETVDVDDMVYTVTGVETVIGGENHGKIFVTITEGLNR